MSVFPNPPTDGQVFDHPNGLEYVYDATNKTWNLVYATGTNTGTLPLINPTSYTLPTSLPEVPPGTVVQADYNAWLFSALQHVNKEANVEIEPAPGPDNPDIGRLWYNSDTDKLYLYHFDGSSSQWVEIVGGGDVDLNDYATITYSDEEDAKLQAQIDALTPEPDLGPPTTVQRLYRFSRTTLNNGEMFGSSEDAELMNTLVFADKDAANQDTPVYSPGDEISFGGWTYKVTNTNSGIEYVSGPGGNITVGTRYAVTFTIYPTGLANRVAAGEEIQAEIQATIDTALTTQADIQTEQGVQNNQINALETQVQLLAQTQAAGKWTYERYIESGPRPPRPSTFYGTHKDDVSNVLTDWSDLRLIMVDKQDLNGTIYTFANFEEGDKIEILATDGSSACFGTVTNNPTLESYGNMIVTVERSNGGPGEGKEYILSVYRPGANGGDVDLDILDQRYLVKTGDTVTGSLAIDNNLTVQSRADFHDKVRIIPNPEDASSNSFIIYGKTNAGDEELLLRSTFHGPDSSTNDQIFYYGLSNTDESLVNAKWVSDAINAAVDNGALADEYLPITGGVLTGNLVLDTGSGLYSREIIKSTRATGYAFQVKPDDTGDATAYIHTNGNAEFAHVKVRDTPTNNSDLTTKEYVDSQIEAIPDVDLSGYLPLAGGTLTGPVDVTGSARIKTKDADDNVTLTLYPSGMVDSKNEIRIDRSGTEQCFVVRQDGSPKLTVRADGRATSEYAIASNSSSKTLTTKEYVDQAVAQANLLGPARLAWKRSGVTNSDADPGDGYFRIHLAGGATYYRFSFKTANGVDFGYRPPDDSGAWNIDYGPSGTIWLYYPDTNQWRLKQQFRVDSWRWNYNNHIEFKRSSKFGVSDIDFTTNSVYYFTIGGFF